MMARADDAAALTRLLAGIGGHARHARAHLTAMTAEGVTREGVNEEWLSALDDVVELLDLATGLRLMARRLGEDANRTHAE